MVDLDGDLRTLTTRRVAADDGGRRGGFGALLGDLDPGLVDDLR